MNKDEDILNEKLKSKKLSTKIPNNNRKNFEKNYNNWVKLLQLKKKVNKKNEIIIATKFKKGVVDIIILKKIR